MKKLFFLFTGFLLLSCGAKTVNYKYVGCYQYVIINDSLHQNNSFLSPDSYGYVIGNLDFTGCGIKILNIEKLNLNDEYIITINHPIEQVHTDSNRIKGEGQEHLKKKPLDIQLNSTKTTDSVYIYRLKPKGKYRLMIP